MYNNYLTKNQNGNNGNKKIAKPYKYFLSNKYYEYQHVRV